MNATRRPVPIRRRLRRREFPGHVRFLTFSCYRRLPLFGHSRIRDAFVEQLSLTKLRLGFELYAWVVMPEHVHLLLLPSPPDMTVTRILRGLKRPFAEHVLNRWRELDAPVLGRIVDARGNEHFWQRGGGYDRNIVSEDEYFEKCLYIHHNPVKRGLVESAVQWKWSSARWYELKDDSTLACDPPPI